MQTSNLTFHTSPSDSNLDFSVATPIKFLSGKHPHTRTMKTRCNARFELTLDLLTTSAEWSLSTIVGFSTDVTVRAPWRDFCGEIEHTGPRDKFQNTVSEVYETD